MGVAESTAGGIPVTALGAEPAQATSSAKGTARTRRTRARMKGGHITQDPLQGTNVCPHGVEGPAFYGTTRSMARSSQRSGTITMNRDEAPLGADDASADPSSRGLYEVA